MINFGKICVALQILCTAATVSASAPKVKPLPEGTLVTRISDNGQWGLSPDNGESESGETFSAGGAVVNLSDMTSYKVSVPASGFAGIEDITDDGLLIVGSCDDKPAFYKTDTKQWTALPLPDGTMGGTLLRVTPDGSRAVGLAYIGSEWNAVPIAYDLTKGTLLNFNNLPTLDMNHDVSEFHRFADISADGRYIVGRLSEQILSPVAMCAYVYDTQTSTYDFIGFTPNDTRVWTPEYKHCYFIDDAIISPNGKNVSGGSYVVHEIEGQDYYNEYFTAYRYNVASKSITVFDGAYDSDAAGFSIADDGTVFASVPAVNPYSSMAIRQGNYYYMLDEIFKQAYGIDFYQSTGYGNTGKAASCSADGRTLAVITGPSTGYILQVDEPWSDICKRVNLLSDFSAAPAQGSVFSALNTVTLTFNRNIEISGAASRIKLLDADGKTLASAASASTKDRVLTINFRNYDFETGKIYSVVIPAGFVTMTGDALVASDEIRLTYTGRRQGAVAQTNVLPANGSVFSRLDASTNFISLTFDASIKIADGAKAELWRVNESEPFTDLALSLYNATTLLVYPAYTQYLYDGTDYKVVIPAGSVTDLSGSGANEQIELNYSGNYVREVSADDKYIFSDECQNYNGFMFYDGDRLTPATVPAGWGFTADIPWALVSESKESTNMALAAHSMFDKPGKADDWAVTPQLFIPDARCYLSFEAQSYLKSKTDMLKVYVFASDKGYSTLTKEIVEDMRTNGDIVFNKQLSPGNSEEGFDGDWTNYVVDLSKYAGKNIYIAFVNDNEDQSAVIIDRVEVIHDLQYLTSITSPATLVKADNVTIEGVITVTSDVLKIASAEMTLKNAAGSAVSTFKAANLDLDKGKTLKFAFAEPLALNPGTLNRYSIEIVINGTETSTLNFSVKNLEFAPVHHVVIEEYSGAGCTNCPLGFLALDNLEKLYPGTVIPVLLRTYQSDQLGAGLESYTSFLGLENLGAPSGTVNRMVSCYPMVSDNNSKYSFTGRDNDAYLWFDAVTDILQNAPDAEVNFTAVYDDKTGDITIDGNTRFALNSSTNVSLFSVLLENGLATRQGNNLYAITDPILGEWGAGGLYGKNKVDIIIDHVARQSFGTTFNGTPGMVPSVQQAGVNNPFSFTVSKPDNIADITKMSFVVMMINSDNDAVINANIVPVSVINAAIDEVNGDDTVTPAEYYNLQGMRIANPAKGQLVIKRQGNKTSKIIF